MSPITLVGNLLNDGFDVAQCLDVLCDGEVLASYGITDADTQSVEDAFDYLSKYHQQHKVRSK